MAFSCLVRNSPHKFTEIYSKRLPKLVVALHSAVEGDVEKLCKIIISHPFPEKPLLPVLQNHVPSSQLPAAFVESVLGRLFASHSNGLKALEFFRFSLRHPCYVPSSDAFEKTLHILARMRYFEKAWEFMYEITHSHPFLLTTKSMSILLSRIAKFGSYEDSLAAFERMKEIFVGRSFGIEEFNTLLRAFCTQRTMKDAQLLFVQMCDRFPPNNKTMDILLLGFKETGDISSMDLFYHDLRRRGFQPNEVTFSIRIDAYCKKGYIADAQRIFEEMEQAKYAPSLELLTTLILGAGIAKNAPKAWEFFNEIRRRNMKPDVGAYNALISSLVHCRDLKAVASLMAEMDEKCISHDDVTYRTVFSALVRAGDSESVVYLFHKMIARNFVPKERTVVMLVKFLCLSGHLELGLQLWCYILERGHTPHRNALHLLVTALCSRSRVDEALDCCQQLLETGICPKKETYEMLKSCCQEDNQTKKLIAIDQLLSTQLRYMPPQPSIVRPGRTWL